MIKILGSATKIAFLLLILGAIGGFFLKLISGEQFMSLASLGAMAYWKSNTINEPK